MSEHLILRSIQVEAHQFYLKGFFHAWGGLSEHGFAIVESEDGRIGLYPCNGYSFKFLDRVETK